MQNINLFYLSARFTFVILISLGLFPPLSTSLLADNSNVILLDASRRTLARDANLRPIFANIKDQLDELVADQELLPNLGLILTNTKELNSCDGGKELFSSNNIDYHGKSEALMRLNPFGGSDIVSALEKFHSLQKQRKLDANLIIITSGQEDCNPRLCMKLKEHTLPTIKRTLVVDFHRILNAPTKADCLIDAIKANYIELSDTSSLRSVILDWLLRKAEKKGGNRSLSLTPPEETETASEVQLQETLPPRAKLVLPDWLDKTAAAWTLIPLSGSIHNKDPLFTSFSYQEASTGFYEIAIGQQATPHLVFLTGEVIKLENNVKYRIQIKTGVKLSLPKEMKSIYSWSLMDPVSKETNYFFTDAGPHPISTGKYRAYVRQDVDSEQLDFGLVQIADQTLNTLDFKSVFVPVMSAWHTAPIDFWALEDISTHKPVYKSKDFHPVLMPPGTYDFVIKPGGKRNSIVNLGPVKIRKNRKTEFQPDTGIKLIVQDPNRTFYKIELLKLSESGKVLDSIFVSNLNYPVIVSPGRYRIRSWSRKHSKSPQTLIDSVKVKSGTLLEVEL